MALSIGVNIHAKTVNDPTFEFYRQTETGTLVLRVGGDGNPAATIFLDEHSANALRKVLDAQH